MLLMRKNHRRYAVPVRGQDKLFFKDYRVVIACERYLGLDRAFFEGGNPIDHVAVSRLRKVFQFLELLTPEIYVAVMAFIAIFFRMSKGLLAVMTGPAEFSFLIALFRNFSRIDLKIEFQFSMTDPAGISYPVTPVGEGGGLYIVIHGCPVDQYISIPFRWGLGRDIKEIISIRNARDRERQQENNCQQRAGRQSG